MPKTQINAKKVKGAAVPKKTSGAKFNPKDMLISGDVIRHNIIKKQPINLFFFKNFILVKVATNAYNI